MKKRENIIGTSEKTKHKINREKREKKQKSNSPNFDMAGRFMAHSV